MSNLPSVIIVSCVHRVNKKMLADSRVGDVTSAANGRLVVLRDATETNQRRWGDEATRRPQPAGDWPLSARCVG
jgi:hypothetical protein